MPAPFTQTARVVWALTISSVWVICAPPEMAAQTIGGRVMDRDDRRPLAGALVRLVDPAGDPVLATTADSTGLYRLEAPAPGRYRIRARHIGYDLFESDLIDASGADRFYPVDVLAQRSPVPIEGVEVPVDRVNRRIGQLLGTSPNTLRIRPIRRAAVLEHAAVGRDLSELLRWARIPNFEVIRTRQGPCYQFRGRGCLNVYLDGARLSRSTSPLLPLEMIHTVVVTLPNELIAYPDGGVHLYTEGWLR